MYPTEDDGVDPDAWCKRNGKVFSKISFCCFCDIVVHRDVSDGRYSEAVNGGDEDDVAD